MSLFTSTLVINDGTSDRTFTFAGQLLDSASLRAGEYVEGAAEPAVASKLIARHNRARSGQNRHLLQIAVNEEVDSDGSNYEPIVWNLTCSHGPRTSKAQIIKQFLLMKNAMGETNFVDNFIANMV